MTLSRLFFLVLFLPLFLGASTFDESNSSSSDELNGSKTFINQKVLYLSFNETPKRVIKGEIFSITLKLLSTVPEFETLDYAFDDYDGLKLINEAPIREFKDKFYYDTFYFIVEKSKAKLPSITASITTQNGFTYKPTRLQGEMLEVIALNPPKNFAKIVAESFEFLDFKTTSYDDRYNIVVFSAKAKRCDIEKLSLKGPLKQGIESVYPSYDESKITYYAIIGKDIEHFTFSYFNLIQNRFQELSIPIIVHDDTVTTQSDLKPTDQSKEKLKSTVAAVVAFVGLALLLFRRRFIYIILIIVPLVYIAFQLAPSKEVCVKEGSEIYLLPVYNGTIFETTSSELIMQKEGEVNEFVKVKLKNEKIGWIKNENLCSR